MSLSQKELETFLWDWPKTCAARGLHIAEGLFAKGRRYRHLRLDPYGVAQQVSVRFDVRRNVYYVRVVACSTGTITSAHYQQAQQQLAALRALLKQTTQAAGLKLFIGTYCVLIGREVQLTGELAAALAGDPVMCNAFTYRYEVDGIRFKEVSAPNCLLPVEQAALDWLATDLLAEHADAQPSTTRALLKSWK